MALTEEQRKAFEAEALGPKPADQLSPEAKAFRSTGRFAEDINLTPSEDENRAALAGMGIVSSSAPEVKDEKDTINTVKGLTAPNFNADSAKAASDAYIKLLTDREDKLEERRKQETERINAQFDETARKTQKSQFSEQESTKVALTRVGGYLGTQISGVGVLNNLAAEHRAELASLESKRASAIAEAQSAIDDKQFELAKLKATEVKDLDKTINDRRNKFFDQSLDLIKEQRAQDKDNFDRQVNIIDKVAPTVVDALETFTNESDAAAYIFAAAKDFGVDPDLLLGEANSILAERRDEERKQVFQLAQKYPDADITTDDTFSTAQTKVRGSKSYTLDIAKAEADLANTRSLINKRASDNSIDFSDPILSLYTQSTGRLVDSPGDARAILGYAESLLADKEVVADDFEGTLLDNQIRAKDAAKLLTDSFGQLQFGTKDTSESDVWGWLSSDDAQGMTDEEKGSYIMKNFRKNPEDFGIYI